MLTLTPNDYMLLDKYMDCYGDAPDHMPASSYMQYWRDAKTPFLSSIFKDKLIYEVPIHNITLTPQTIAYNICNKTELHDLLYSLDVRYMTDHPDSPDYPATELFGNLDFIGNNRIILDTPTITINGVIIHNNEKYFHALRRYSKSIRNSERDFETIKGIELEYSRQHGYAALSGTLCLSIHPLDYFTLSDNDCGWKSCVNWMHQGEYRLGTLELLTSPYVVVAYLKAKKPFHFYQNYTWNNKKWRQLFIVTPESATAIRDYPFHAPELTEMAFKLLNSLVSKPYIYEIKSPEFWTEYMYNDTENHPVYTFCNTPTSPYREGHQIVYSGTAHCISCGAAIHDLNEMDEQSLVCEKCYCQTYTCDNCGKTVSDDEVFVDENGYVFCPECTHTCSECGELFGDWTLENDLCPRCHNRKYVTVNIKF